MHTQLKLIMESVRSIVGQNDPKSAPTSPKIQINNYGQINEEVYRNSLLNRRTKSTEDLPVKHQMTPDEMRRFYSPERHARHDSFGRIGSTESDDSTNEAINRIRDGSPCSRSRYNTLDSVRSNCDLRGGSSCNSGGGSGGGLSKAISWLRGENDTTSPRLSRENSINESDHENIGENYKDCSVR